MSEKKEIDRRDFLKFGSLAAIALPTLKEIGRDEDHRLFESEELFGGFAIRVLDRDTPPYEVDDSVYQRFDSRNTAFGRMMWDEEAQTAIFSAKKTIDEYIAEGKPGFRKEDFALHNAAWTVGNGSGAYPGLHGLQMGLLKIDPFYPNETPDAYAIPWDRSHLTDEDITRMVKKASKFYGASLVGVAELDERWFYSYAFDFLGEGPIVFEDVEEITLPEGQVTLQEAKALVGEELAAMEADELKDFIVTALESVDPADFPADAPSPAMMGSMPAKQFATMLPMMLGKMPAMMYDVFAAQLGLPFVIAKVDPSSAAKPKYLEDNTLVIPRTMNRVIVMAFEMDHDAIDTYPAQIGSAAAANGYSRMTFTSSCLAEFIRMLGYNAIPCANQTGLSVPMAIDAGLGELGRQGILITPKYGPRVRLAKVITDMPLNTDSPISFGVTEFCDVCGKCARECPGQAISYEARSSEARTISNNPGVKKWPIDPIKCFGVWQSLAGGDCGTCIRSCPFTKADNWLHEVTRVLIGAKSGSIDALMLKMDDLAGYGTQADPDKFWEKDSYIHIKD